MKNRIAFIVPTFNRRDLVTEAVENLLALKIPAHWDFGVVVVDDGSEDGTFESLTEIFSAESKVKILRQENSERGAARNCGARWAIEQLDCEWLLFVDSDDVLLDTALQHLSDRLESLNHKLASEAVAAYGQIEIWLGGDKPAERVAAKPNLPEGDLSKLVLKRPVLPLGATFVSRRAFESIGGFCENRAMSGSEDWVFLIRLALAGRVIHIPKILILYRQHGGNTAPYRTLESIQLAVEELGPHLKKHFGGNWAPRKLARLGNLLKAGALTSHGLPGEAMILLSQAVRDDWRWLGIPGFRG